MNKNIAIKVSNLTKVYKLYDKPIDRLKESLHPLKKQYHKDFYALNDVSFEIKKGETVGIIGKNGAGKSTLLKIITGVLTPTSGNIQANGRIASLLELGAGFNPEYTGIENIYLQGTLMGYSREEREEKIESILEFADLGDFVHQQVKTYSSGMFARLAFSVAINVDPDVLIVDEALSVGDIFFQQKCNKVMTNKFFNKTVIFVTHDFHALSSLCEKSILMHDGTIRLFDKTNVAIEEFTKILHNINAKNENHILECVNNTSNLFEHWLQVNQNKLSGTKEVIIRKIALTNIDNQMLSIIEPGDICLIQLLINTSKPIENIIFGYIVRDRVGNDVFGENTPSLNKKYSFFESGEYHVIYKIVWPKVKPGEYTITPGIGEGDNPVNHVVHCWANNIIVIKAINHQTVNCFFNNNIEDFTLMKIDNNV